MFTTTSIRIPTDLHKQLKAAAQIEGRSVSNMIQTLITKHISATVGVGREWKADGTR